MSTLDVFALVGAALIGVAFFLGRFGELLFVGLGIAVVLGSTVAAASSPGRLADGTLLVVGLALLFFGLGIVRVMMHRSVSLRMLARCSDGVDDGGVEDIRSRLVDVERVGLASRRGGEYRLSPGGRLVATTLTLIYRVSQAGG